MRLPLLFQNNNPTAARVLRALDDIPAQAKGAVIALGNFDGVHLGHQQVIQCAERVAKERNAPVAVMTFEPHPITFFAKKEADTFRLNDAQTKAVLLHEQHVDYVFEMPFNTTFSTLSAEQFVSKILIETLGACHIVCGYDFSFGYQRSGNVDVLRQLCAKYGVEVDVTQAFHQKEEVVSSTRIRNALLEGEVQQVNQLLGHAHIIRGEVVHGDKRGRTIGFPTANILLNKVMAPKKGVYAGWVKIEDETGKLKPAVMNIGNRPTFDKECLLLEVHVLEGEQYDLYDKTLWIQLVEFIRDEQKFDGIEALKVQINHDAQAATTILARKI